MTDYFTKQHILHIHKQLSERDISIITAVQTFKFMSTVQLERLFFTTGTPLSNARVCRRTLKRLTGLNVLQRLHRSIGGARAGSAGFVYARGRGGGAAEIPPRLGGRRLHSPGKTFLTHTLAIGDLFVELHKIERTQAFTVHQFECEPDCWRLIPGYSHRFLKPDAFVSLRTDKYEIRSFIEVDMDTESLTRIQQKLRAYISYRASGKEQSAFGIFPAVIFLVPTDARKRNIDRLIERLPTRDQALFATTTLNELQTVITRGIS